MICTPDKTGRCTTCGDMLSTGEPTDADRIRALEAELAEARKREEAGTRLIAGYSERNRTLTVERDAAQARADKAEADLSSARSEVARLSAEVDEEIALRTKAEADAAAMREALKAARISLGSFANGEPWTHADEEVWRMTAAALDAKEPTHDS